MVVPSVTPAFSALYLMRAYPIRKCINMKKNLFKSLYFQVLLAISLGILLGHFYPDLGAQMKPLGDGFVKLIIMIIAPVIFCTVVTGIGP